MLTSPLLSGSASGSLLLTLSADDNNVNVIEALEAIYGYGCCDGDVVVVVTILPVVEIWSSNASYPALDFFGFDHGASLKLVNYGNIYGKGGTGNSGAGGTALRLGRNITINNTTTGHIYGGGGGGGRGGYGVYFGTGDSDPHYAGGGGGGGGQGRSGGAAGSGGPGDDYGDNGTAGSTSAAGVGGGGGYATNGTNSATGGNGGNGGGWGSGGYEGGSGSGTNDDFHLSQTEQPGGAAGKAIEKHGATITWIAGNNSTQVKGVVD